MTIPGLPVVHLNDAFKRTTGYGDERLGSNCRFLQVKRKAKGGKEASSSVVVIFEGHGVSGSGASHVLERHCRFCFL
jgi:hypothetical protein